MLPREESPPLSAHSAVAPPEVLLLDRCPLCTYALEGLPAEHRCPECGFAFDRRWQAFGGALSESPQSRRLRSLAAFGIVLPFALATLALVKGGVFHVFLIHSAIMLVVLIVIVLRGPNRWLALTPAGLKLYRGKNIIEEFPWESCDQVWYVFSGEIELRGANGKQIIHPKLLFGNNGGDTMRVVNAINAYPHRPGVDARNRTKIDCSD